MSDPESEKSVSVSAKTVEEAIEKGLDILGVSRDEVDITVLKEGSRGILGLGAADAEVRLELHAPALPKATGTETADVSSEQDETVVSELGQEVLAKLLSSIGVEAQVVVGETGTDVEEGQPIVFDIVGRDLGLLIGRRGETLRALQYLTRLIIGRRLGRRANIVVDVEGYKARREQSLAEMAQRMAKQVRENQRSFVLEPMPANERRIVHLALRDDPDVTTQSIGEGNRRKVMIIPNS